MAALSLYGGRCIKSWKLVEDPKFSKMLGLQIIKKKYDLNRFLFLRYRIFFASDVDAQLVCVLLNGRS